MDNQCTFWNCRIPVTTKGFYLCRHHYKKSQDGQVDKCPDCGQYKSATYASCLNCRFKKSSTSSKSSEYYPQEYSKAWESGDAEATTFYVYVLKLNDGSFYAGHTREINERLMEHRDGRVKSTANRDPKFVWFAEVDSRDEATRLEAEVKKICDQDSREMRRWIIDLRIIVEELDFE